MPDETRPCPEVAAHVRFADAAPTTLFAASPTRDWVGVCQPRADADNNGRIEVTIAAHGSLEGDPLSALIVDSQGTKTVVDQFVGTDTTGQWLAYTQQGQLWLAHAQSGKRTALTAAASRNRGAASASATYFAASFDAARARLAYLREGKVIVRELATGTETPFDPGNGLVQRIAFEPDGKLLRLDVASVDSNGNGRLDAPKFTRGVALCQSPIASFTVASFNADEPRTRLLDLSSGQVREAPGFVMSMGRGAIMRGAERELWLEDPEGTKQKLSSPTCNGRILHVDEALGHVLLGCAERYGARRDLYLRTASKLHHLRLDVAAFETDSRFAGQPRLLGIPTRSETILLDFARASVHPLGPDVQVLATYDQSALIERQGKLLFVTAEGSAPNKPPRESDTSQRRTPLSPLLRDGPRIAVGKQLYDLSLRTLVGSFESFPLALTSDNYGLLPERVSDAERLATGPLRWQLAQPDGAAPLSTATCKHTR